MVGQHPNHGDAFGLKCRAAHPQPRPEDCGGGLPPEQPASWIAYPLRRTASGGYAPRVLSRQDFEALLARCEKNLRSQRRRCKAAPTEALQQELALLTRRVGQLRLADRFYLTTLTSGPRDDLDVLQALLPGVRALPLAWICHIGVALSRIAEGVWLVLVVKGAFAVVEGLLPGVPDVAAMRFHAFEATTTGATVEEALASAKRAVIDQIEAHQSAIEAAGSSRR